VNNDSHSIAWNDSESLEAHLLGLVDFDSALMLQERLVFEVSGRSDRLGCLLICEHPPEITLGRESSRLDVSATDSELVAKEIPLRWVGRGGSAMVHSPGQLAIYPVLPLDRLGIGVMEFRRRLESALVDVCHELRIAAKRRDEAPGVWTRHGQVAFVGAAVKSGVSFHGAFLNVCPDASFLRLANNTPGQPATTLEAQRVRPVGMNQVREAVSRRIAAVFQYSQLHTYVGHPLLKRTQRRICTHA